MRFTSHIARFNARRPVAFLTIAFFLLEGCHGRIEPSEPGIQISQVPPASAGGPVQMDHIGGKVTNPRAGAQIVLYARSGIWWIQPFANQPFTQIQPDLTWRNTTHLGTEYAAILVEPGYHPPSKLSTLPAIGGGVIAVTTAQGKAGAPIPSKTIHFSGYDWTVRAADSDRGGEPNSYDPANVWTDDKGYLHLRMEEREGRWSCAEMSLTRSLGYGSYNFVVEDIGRLGPSAVLGLYTNDDFRTDDVRTELDIELSHWGDPKGKNAQFVVQPFYIPENISRFMAPTGVLTHTFRWEPGRASFTTVRGSIIGSGGMQVSQHVFTSDVPTPANEKVHIDLYDYHHSKSSLQQPAEVVIEKFEYLP